MSSDVSVIEIEAKSVLNRVRGMPYFAWSINPYRGCFHQCVFCYARNTHAFLERDGVLDWGSRLYAKVNAPAVLRRELAKRSWKGQHVAVGTATDPYQPIEGRYRITRGILEALADARTPGHLITRSPLVIRDIDVLQRLCRHAEFHVTISLPTVDVGLARELEPTVAPPRQRLLAAQRLASAGIPTSIAVAPVIPKITDQPEQLAEVVDAACAAGVTSIWQNTLNLNDVARESFFRYLRAKRPDLVPAYERLYRSKYAGPAVVRDIEERFGDALGNAKLDPPPRIPLEREPAPLTLF